MQAQASNDQIREQLQSRDAGDQPSWFERPVGGERRDAAPNELKLVPAAGSEVVVRAGALYRAYDALWKDGYPFKCKFVDPTAAYYARRGAFDVEPATVVEVSGARADPAGGWSAVLGPDGVLIVHHPDFNDFDGFGEHRRAIPLPLRVKARDCTLPAAPGQTG